jgi:putative glycosyltransferase (TIGR04372 family)
MTNTAMIRGGATDALHARVATMLGRPVNTIRATGSGANSTVFMVEAEGARYALKLYPTRSGDDRQRAAVEWRALIHFRTCGIANVPAPIAVDEVGNFLLMTWIEGARPERWDDIALEQALAFIATVFASSDHADARGFPLASEACLSGAAIAEQINDRLAGFIEHEALNVFLSTRLRPLLDHALAAAKVPDFETELAPRHRRLIPADFGLHNAIRTAAGGISFVDFDYMGWDDPVKLVGDILLHPAIPLPPALSDHIGDAMRRMVPKDGEFAERLRRFLPLYGLRWALIVLNPLRRDRQGSYAVPASVAALHLKTAEVLCARVETMLNGPSMNDTISSSKMRGIGPNPRAWLNLAATAPALALLWSLRGVGTKIALYADQFGHQAFDIEYHLRTTKPGRARAVFVHGSHVPNSYLLEKHQEIISILRVPDFLIRYLRRADLVSRRTFGRQVLVWEGFEKKLLHASVWNEESPRIVFSEEEHARGKRILGRLGLIRGRYVCLYARDSAYPLKHLATMLAVRNPRFGGNREAARTSAEKNESSLYQRNRNTSFSGYSATLARLADDGLIGVRMGAEVDGDLEGSLPNLVDFGGRHRKTLGADASFADIYLMAHCRFSMGTGGGVVFLGYIFNRPTVYVNTIPWPWENIPPQADAIYLPKLLVGPEGILTFREMIKMSRQTHWRAMYRDAFFEERGLSVVDNTPHELADAADEMCRRLDGTWSETTQDRSLQKRLMTYADPDYPMYRMPSRMGAGFLRNHSDLIG